MELATIEIVYAELAGAYHKGGFHKSIWNKYKKKQKNI